MLYPKVIQDYHFSMSSLPNFDSTPRDIFDVALVLVDCKRPGLGKYKNEWHYTGTRAVLTYRVWNEGQLEVKVAAQAFVDSPSSRADVTKDALNKLLESTMTHLNERGKLESDEEGKDIIDDFVDEELQ